MVKALPKTRRRSARIAGQKGRIQKKTNDGKALARVKKKHCQVCSEICRMISLPLNAKEEEVAIGTWSYIVSSGCQTHLRIFQDIFGRDGGMVENSGEIRLKKVPGFPSIYAFCFWTTPAKYLPGVSSLMKVPCGQSQYGHGKRIDDHWIDVSLLCRWISTCANLHGNTCHTERRVAEYSATRPRLLIDTRRMCLKRASAEDSYVALSYVWGKCTTLKATNANLEDLLKDQALSLTAQRSQIPRTVMDAIKLLGVIDERNLWVDSLCIVQDDLDSLQHQLNSMASIYANARFTIIASDGADANYGLRAIREISEPRKHWQRLLCFANTDKVILSPMRKLIPSNWDYRGWVFQEDIFSRRRLLFHHNMVHWECSSCTWREDYQCHSSVDMDLEATSQRKQVHTLLSQPWPNLDTYSGLVQKYNTRVFTFPEDVLAAFDGLISRIGGTFGGGFLWGLPEMFFDVALLWRMEGLNRRNPSRLSSISHIPSWTWMAVQGYFPLSCWKSGSNYIFGSLKPTIEDLDTIPILQWYSFSRNDGKRRCIPNSWRKYIDCRMGGVSPPGWESHGETLGCRPYFTHDSISDSQFTYPIPIHEQPKRENLKKPGDLIACRTQRAHLNQAWDVRGAYEVYLPHSLLIKEKEWVGSLYWDDKNLSNMPKSCELIAISAGHESNFYHATRLDQWVTDKKLHSRRVFEFFNVLWIEWKDGIAYRKGVGKVLKDKWEALELEWIDVVLG